MVLLPASYISTYILPAYMMTWHSRNERKSNIICFFIASTLLAIVQLHINHRKRKRRKKKLITFSLTVIRQLSHKHQRFPGGCLCLLQLRKAGCLAKTRLNEKRWKQQVLMGFGVVANRPWHHNNFRRKVKNGWQSWLFPY